MTTSPQSDKRLVLQPGRAGLGELRRILAAPTELLLHDDARTAIDRSVATVQKVLDGGQIAYGINTGFGLLAQTRIEPDRLSELQRKLVLSHAAGTGELLDDDVVRLIVALKVLSLARGHSGIRAEVIDALLALINAGVFPCIPSKGSVGASGDLAPLAHMSAALLGEGEVRIQGKQLPAIEGLAIAGLEPLTLGPKEGLALLNGTQVSTALALKGLFATEDLFAAAVVSGSLSIEAMKASLSPFDARIHELRGQKGQIDVAASYRELLAGSEINASHADCDRVQDPYSLRCQPQVMGACLDSIRHAASRLLIEANAVTDNPLIFPEQGDVVSGGNFHAEPVAIAADILAVAIAEIGALSERRLARIVDPHMSGLPAFLVENSGVNSGFMIAQVTAAALASENKSLAHPASVDSLPTSANQEDHVSMATYAARRLGEMTTNSQTIVAIELLAACQGIEFLRPLRSSEILERMLQTVREQVPAYDQDRFFAPDIEAARQIVASGPCRKILDQLLPSG